jgi:hypothetical protein
MMTFHVNVQNHLQRGEFEETEKIFKKGLKLLK